MTSTNSFRNGAKYLNNLGCALLEHGAFDAALETFQDAVYIMKNGVWGSSTRLSAGDLDLATRIQQANQRMACPRPCKVVLKSRKVAPFAIFSIEDYVSFQFETINFHADQFIMCPVRIEDDTLEYPERSTELESGILLLNLGLAYACLSKCHSGSDRVHLQDVSCRVLQMADSILYNTQTNTCDDEMNSERWSRTVFVNMACLHSLMQILIDRQGDDESMGDDSIDAALERLHFLQQTLDRGDACDLRLPYDPLNCHAAAA